MFKYIKWELIDDFRKKRLIFGFIAIIYLLVLIFPGDSQIMKYLVLPLSIILMGSLLLTFIAGAKRTMDTYQNQTFLLESMIPLSPNKILLAKYILAIFFNILYCIIFILGLSVVLAKADINFIKEILNDLFSLSFNEWTVLFRVFFVLLSSSIATTAMTTLVFLFLKSIFPNGKGLRIIAFIGSGVVMNVIASTFLASLIELFKNSDIADVFYSLILIGMSVVCYFISVYFVKNKLEIYN